MPKNYSFKALGLLDESTDQSVLNIIDLASSMLDAPISFASLIEHSKSRQYIPASIGFPSELEEARETPIEESICKYVQKDQKTITIPDLLLDDRTKDNPLIHRYGLRSYLGTPIHAVSGKTIGALCCMHTSPTRWTALDIATLEKLALCVDDIIKARALALEEQKANEKLAQLAAARSGFIAHMSHEIRTPLTGFIGSVRLLNSMNLEGKSGELINLLNRSSSRLLDVVKDALQLAKLDAGQFKIVEEECNLGVLVREVMTSHLDIANSKSVDLRVNDGLSGNIYLLDRRAMDSIVHNLLGNAVKFTETGYAQIDLSEDESGQVVIDFIDTGIGIPEEYHATIFEEFEQAGPKIARKYGGTGLGMAIVKRLVEMMDGEIILQSRPSEGTKVSVILPLRIVGPPQCVERQKFAFGSSAESPNASPSRGNL